MNCAYLILAMAGLTLTSAGLHAAQDRSASVDRAGAQLIGSGCGSDAPEAKRFLVPKADGGTRTMEICNVVGGDPAATAWALSEAIDAERGKDKFYIHSRMPDLLALRVVRARMEVDPSLTNGERLRKLTAISVEIDELENEISKSAPAQ